jgi:hypothetical protein
MRDSASFHAFADVHRLCDPRFFTLVDDWLGHEFDRDDFPRFRPVPHREAMEGVLIPDLAVLCRQ